MNLIKNLTIISFCLYLFHTTVTAQPAISSNKSDLELAEELKNELLKKDLLKKEEKERLSRLKAQQHLIKEPSASHLPPKATNEMETWKQFKDCVKCPEMIVLPSGSFLMGTPKEPAPDPFSNAPVSKFNPYTEHERPVHRVQIKSFAIGKFEVTQEEWYEIMGNNPSFYKGRRLPVNVYKRHDVNTFIKLLSEKTGRKYRLPSESEWEYAARAGSTSKYPWGESPLLASNYAWFQREKQPDEDQAKYFKNLNKFPIEVGSKKPNQFNLYDMIGNVREIVEDCGDQVSREKGYEGAPTDGSPSIIGRCSNNIVLRGGSFLATFEEAGALRSGAREIGAEYFGESTGFRLAWSLTTKEEDKRKIQSEKIKDDEEIKRTSGPSDGYGGRIRGRIKPNIHFLEEVESNNSTDVEVRCSSDGTIIGIKLLKSSGNVAWDSAVIKALEKTAMIPRDIDGRVFSPLVISFRPKD